MALEHRSIETNGIRLHCALDGDGPLVVLLHGFPECWYSWRHQIPALARRFRVVAPDMRGYNLSDKPPGVTSYALSELTADVFGLIHALGEREAVIVGHDWGGGVAWNVAMEHPAATRRLATLNCPHPAVFSQHLRSNPIQLARSWYMFFFQVPWLPETLLGLNDAWAIANAVRQSAVRREAITDEDLAVLRAAASQPGALEAAINYYRAVFRGPEMTASWPVWLRRFFYGDAPQPPARLRIEDWPKITTPTLVIWGEDDVALVKELTLGLEELVTGPLTRRFVPNCGHWVHQEQPDLVNGFLLEFLDDLAPAATPAAS